MANDGNRIYIGATGVEIADLQHVLGRSTGDLGLLCSDQKWNAAGTELQRVNSIIPMAKYKPVRHSKLGILTNAERSSTRYGFGGGLLPTLDLSQNSPQNDWVYYPPRGAANNEWFRIRDFEGYVQDACSPLAITVGQLVYDGESQILLFGDGMSNAVREDGMTWVNDQSLSIAELLQGNQSANGYYISFILIDTTDHAKVLLVTNKTMSNFVETEYSHYIFKVFPETTTESGITYPSVPLLSQSRSGHAFEIIVCLMAGNNPQSGYGYAVYTPDNTPGFLGLLPYSIGFVAGCDRIERTLGTGAFNLNGLKITSVVVTYTDMITEVTYNNFIYRAFRINVKAVFDTTSAGAWVGDEKTISGMLTLSDGSSFPFGPSPSQGESTKEIPIATSVTSNSSGQEKNIYTSGSDNYLWVMKYNGSLISNTVTAIVMIDYPLDSPESKSGNVTIS